MFLSVVFVDLSKVIAIGAIHYTTITAEAVDISIDWASINIFAINH